MVAGGVGALACRGRFPGGVTDTPTDGEFVVPDGGADAGDLGGLLAWRTGVEFAPVSGVVGGAALWGLRGAVA